MDLLNYPTEQVFTAYLQTCIARQKRAEPLYELAYYFAVQAIDPTTR